MHQSFDLEKLEVERSMEQEKLDSRSSRKARNELGQFATPAQLADDITKAALQFCDLDRIRFFEPALGTGAFFGALLRQVSRARIVSAMGIEINDACASVARRLWKDTGLRVMTEDFTRIEPQKVFKTSLPNIILTTPAYVRHHHLKSDYTAMLQRSASRVVRNSISGLSGLYVYFVLAAHEWLAENGIGAWLIPAEFMDVNYGEVLRRYLSCHVELLQMHRFDPTEVQFADALVSSAVVILRRRKPSEQHAVVVSHGGSVAAPKGSEHVELSRLRSSCKWSQLFTSRSGLAEGRGCPLSSLFIIKRGIATGANDFFILPRRELARLEIDEQFVKPILPSARLLEEAVIASDSSGFPLIDDQMVVIDTEMPLEDIRKSCKGLWRYLKSGEERGIHEGYLLRNRDPWYRQEQRAPAPFLCTYMGRKKASGKTFRFFWNRSRAIAANTYLLLYPTNSLRGPIANNPVLGERIVRLLNSLAPKDFVDNGRVYGGGLFKMEPRELGRVDGRKIIEELNLSIPEQGSLISHIVTV